MRFSRPIYRRLSIRRNPTGMTRKEFEHISVSMRGKLTSLIRRFPKEAILPLSAEDIAQEALAALWTLSEKGYPIKDPEALAVTVAKNICVSHYRRKKIHMLPFENRGAGQKESGEIYREGKNLAAKDFEGGFSATSRTDAADIAVIRERLFRELTPTQRKYISMRNDKGLSLEEIAAATGRPKSSIKTTISTARRLLLEKLKKGVL